MVRITRSLTRADLRPAADLRSPTPFRPSVDLRQAKPASCDLVLRAFALPLDWAADTIEQMAAHPPQSPRIDRRRVKRQSHRMRAFLEPLDPMGAIRSPLIYTRDADSRGLGFICRRDVSMLGQAEVALPMTTGRPLQIRCVVRRCREIAPRWFEGWIEFHAPQPRLTAK